jgi:hypothetical protein
MPIIEELKTEVEKLRTELETAHREIENLVIKNYELERKTHKQEKIIKLYKTITTDDLDLTNKSFKPCVSTPLTRCVNAEEKKEKLKSRRRIEDKISEIPPIEEPLCSFRHSEPNSTSKQMEPLQIDQKEKKSDKKRFA